MKKTMKAVSILLSIVLIVSVFTIEVVANETMPRIYSTEICGSPGEQIVIPIYISDNPGLMGFSFSFSFDNSSIQAVSVERGELLENGMFEDSIGTGNDETFKVIWSGTKNVTDDGELFLIKVKLSDTFVGNQTINVTFSQKDTFNERWEPVQFNCSPIVIQIKISDDVLTLVRKIFNIAKIFFVLLNAICKLGG